MKNFVRAIIAGALLLSAATVTAGYERTGLFESINTTVSQEASYQLSLETLRAISSQPPLEIGGILSREILEDATQIDRNVHDRSAESVDAGRALEQAVLLNYDLAARDL